jgi:hypothetical protein
MIDEAEAPRKRLSFMPGPGDGWRLEVAQYGHNSDLTSMDAVEARLAQFPRGTVFVWSPFNAGQADERKRAVLAELKALLRESE